LFAKQQFRRPAGAGDGQFDWLVVLQAAIEARRNCLSQKAKPSIVSSPPGGGAAHIDTWIRNELAIAKVAGSAYPAIDTAIPRYRYANISAACEGVDRFVLLRTVNHDVIDEHAMALQIASTGRPTSGTVIYPSIGSIVAINAARRRREFRLTSSSAIRM
jgi:hypothetical protein